MRAVILDTDIGTDIDDTWALAMLLKSPELDLKLVVSASGETEHRATLAARMLDIAGRIDVPVGVGVPGKASPVRPQAAFVEGYALADYPGTVYEDGVDAAISAILASPEPVALVSIGPLTNVAEALGREPRIVENARLIGMHGSVRRGYRGSLEPAAEYNVVSDIEACRRAFEASWEVTLTPLDTCGSVWLEGELYRRVREHDDPLIGALMRSYRGWCEAVGAKPGLFERRSTTLYDTVAVWLAICEDLLVIEELPIRVDDEGFTRIDAAGRPLRIATEWEDRDRFLALLADRLVS